VHANALLLQLHDLSLPINCNVLRICEDSLRTWTIAVSFAPASYFAMKRKLLFSLNIFASAGTTYYGCTRWVYEVPRLR
jgi:hypothetical protein